MNDFNISELRSALEALAAAETDHAAGIAEAQRQLDEALAAQADIRGAETRAMVRAMLPAILAAADDADTHFAAYCGAIQRARKLETEARMTLERDLKRFASGGEVMGEAIADASKHLHLLRYRSSQALTPITRLRAERAVSRIISTVGERG